MAAEDAVTYMGKQISNLIKLVPFEFQHLKFFWGLEKELDKLRESLDAIADLVEDAEEKQERLLEERWWLRKLRDVAYEADDLLSELAYEATRLQLQTNETLSVRWKIEKCREKVLPCDSILEKNPFVPAVPSSNQKEKKKSKRNQSVSEPKDTKVIVCAIDFDGACPSCQGMRTFSNSSTGSCGSRMLI